MMQVDETSVKNQWGNIFDLDALKSSIQMITIYIMVYEILEDTVISRPKDFFTIGESDDKSSKEYSEKVLALYDRNACPGINRQRKDIISSLLWFKNLNAIDDNDIKVFADSKKLRNYLSHQMLAAIANGTDHIIEQYVKMYLLFSKIEKWWIKEIELPISGEIELEEIDKSDMVSSNMLILEAIMDMLATDSNARYKDLCEMLEVSVK